MTDWLEELLELVQEEEQPEGPLNWPAEIPTAGRAGTQQSGGGPNSGEQTAGEWTQPWEGEDRPFSRDRRLWMEGSRAEEQAVEGQAQPWEKDRSSSQDGWLGTEELLPLGSPEQAIETARRRLEQTIETAEQKLEWAADGQALPGPAKSAVVEEAGVVRTDTENQTADRLYQQLVRAGRAAEAVRPVRQTTVVEQMSTGAPSLTVDELDRAVRRDSRRYDGGMELY